MGPLDVPKERRKPRTKGGGIHEAARDNLPGLDGQVPVPEMKAGELDEAAVLEATGETRLMAVTQLVARGQGLCGFDMSCSIKLEGLVVLSLSGNLISDLKSLAPLHALEELNLNFNSVSSIGCLRCPGLRKLYLSSNVMTTSALGDLKKHPRLETLCLYRNNIRSLPMALPHLRALPKLKELDLDGNPCTGCQKKSEGKGLASGDSDSDGEGAGYKHRVVRTLVRLHTLDGEKIEALDRDLARLYHAQQDGEAKSRSTRPATAPACGRGMARGRVRLLECDELDDNAEVLTYLAAEVLDNPASEPFDIVDDLRQSYRGKRRLADRPKDGDADSEEIEEEALEGFSSVEVGNATKTETEITLGQTSEADDVGEEVKNEAGGVASSRGDAPPPPPRPSDGMDPSDPHATIRKLLKLVEVLQLERGEGERAAERAAQESSKRIEELEIELRNMSILQDGNKMLKAELQQKRDVEKENEDLKAKLLEAQQDLGVAHGQLQHYMIAAAHHGDEGGRLEARPATAAEVLEGCEDIDAELTELIRLNEQSLCEAQREMELARRDLTCQLHDDQVLLVSKPSVSNASIGGAEFQCGGTRSSMPQVEEPLSVTELLLRHENANAAKSRPRRQLCRPATAPAARGRATRVDCQDRVTCHAENAWLLLGTAPES